MICPGPDTVFDIIWSGYERMAEVIGRSVMSPIRPPEVMGYVQVQVHGGLLFTSNVDSHILLIIVDAISFM